MEKNDFIMGIISAPPGEGPKLAETLVRENLAACVQVSPPVSSVYRWEGEIEQAEEVLLFVKTAKGRVRSIKEFLIKEHSYDVPEFIVLPVTDGLPQYLKWIWKSLQQRQT